MPWRMPAKGRDLLSFDWLTTVFTGAALFRPLPKKRRKPSDVQEGGHHNEKKPFGLFGHSSHPKY
jgi:hypothetical protein